MLAKFKKEKKFDEGRVFQVCLSIFCLGLIGFLIISNLRLNQKRKELTDRIKLLKEEIQILEERKEKLKAQISQTKKESYWEARAREQGYMREGEKMIVIKTVSESPKKEIEKKNLWQKFLEELKNWMLIQ